MQIPNYMLAIAVAWIFTLCFLPTLFARARARAYERGTTDGLTQRDAMTWKRLQDLEVQLENAAIDREQVQRTHLKKTAALLGTIKDLEERIKAYTGLAVTATDHKLIIQASETLVLARRTWDAMKGSEEWRDRATRESEALVRLAGLVLAEVRRNDPAAKTEDAA
ncbi:hypothetical protein V0R50_21070 [Pseudomonas sp. 148P]|uniref:Uncharacterized protein n=1 Tax=Pseudomonas ulcerans TaxID=3115852 RepID=A0ABU7HW34_9PSED|nr:MULTISPECIES: hypothetical protein [unclassified Pseudomonas]MEE1922880.1 hypothetical protein [Pseudomonas sp. 147P]MEE1935730.1 hypothetical protein [Pseudomonas sp. 148P]